MADSRYFMNIMVIFLCNFFLAASKFVTIESFTILSVDLIVGRIFRPIFARRGYTMIKFSYRTYTYKKEKFERNYAKVKIANKEIELSVLVSIKDFD